MRLLCIETSHSSCHWSPKRDHCCFFLKTSPWSDGRLILVDFEPKLRLTRLTCIQYIGRLVTAMFWAPPGLNLTVSQESWIGAVYVAVLRQHSLFKVRKLGYSVAYPHVFDQACFYIGLCSKLRERWVSGTSVGWSAGYSEGYNTLVVPVQRVPHILLYDVDEFYESWWRSSW